MHPRKSVPGTVSDTDVAIIGAAARLPQASGLAEFWRLLASGAECITTISDEDLVRAGIPPALIADPQYVRARSRLADVDMFDAEFFGMSPREAEITDPQQRLFLECAWEALEQAGYSGDRRHRIGVYAGASLSTYLLHHLWPNPSLLSSVGEIEALTANDKDYLATRVSYKLDLRGPSMTVQTACSTSLVAVHLACQSLIGGECDLALAGGVTIVVPQERGYLHRAGGIMAPDGHCRAFDAAASGTVFGNGLGIVVLRRLDEAIEDGDFILAVIKGSAVNNDGAAKIGYTAPSVDGQAAVISEALAVAAVDAATIGYVEAHGTGTPLGDPIEVAALTKAFAAAGVAPGSCALGSVKTNIGHLDAAAGIAGLLKAVLALREKAIPATLHFTRENPQIDFAASPFYVCSTLRPWPSTGEPRRAGVSSFGIGGTNAHVVVEEAPERPQPTPSRDWHLLLMSARSEPALETASSNLAHALESLADEDLADVAYTLQVGRRRFRHRRMLVVHDRAEAIGALRGREPVRGTAVRDEREGRPIVFMFSGTGAQYAGMAKQLYEAEPLFRPHVDRCADLLAGILQTDIRGLMFGEDEAASGQLERTDVAQPALFVIEYSLAQLWMAWGVKPHAMIGYGLGEYVAACIAGVCSLADALRLVAHRARLVQSIPGGSMLAVSPSIPFVSNVTGNWFSDSDRQDPEYWGRHLREPVRFAEGWARVRAIPDALFLEVGPGRSLAAIVRGLPHAEPVYPSLPHESGEESDTYTMVTSLGRLWVAGGDVRWPAFGAAERRRRLPLPTYPFERRRYWIEPPSFVTPRPDAHVQAGARAERIVGVPIPGTAVHPRPILQTPFVQTATDVERVVAGMWEDLLGTSPIGVQDNFFELGGNSLMATRLVSLLQDAFSVEVPLRQVFEMTTVAELSQLIESLLADKVGDLSEAEAERLLTEVESADEPLPS